MNERRAEPGPDLDAIHARDAEAAANRYTEDAVLIAPGGRYQGRQEIAGFLASWLGPFSDPQVDDWYRREEGGRGVVASSFSATHTDPLELPSGKLVPATGRSVTIEAMETFTLDSDSQITEHRFYFDRADVFAQLGVDTTWTF